MRLTRQAPYDCRRELQQVDRYVGALGKRVRQKFPKLSNRIKGYRPYGL